MKKLFALLLSLAMLACLTACGKDEAEPKQAEKAEKLHTFAGLAWDTPASECEAALEKATGIGFGFNPWVYTNDLEAEPGYYSVLGMPLDVELFGDSLRVNFVWSETAEERGEANYDNDADWVLSDVSCHHSAPLNCDAATGEISPEELAIIQGVIDNAIRKYGQPDLACLYGDYIISDLSCNFGGYSVPAKGYAYIAQDCFSFAREQGWNSIYVELRFHNVSVVLNATPPEKNNSGMWSNGEYNMSLTYYSHQLSKELVTHDGYEVEVFPWLNGEPDYVVIDP